MAPPTQGRIELEGVSKHYAGTPAVDGVSLNVDPGTFFSLLGPSGCGKTTTLRLIAGFAYPDSGEVLIDGRSTANDPPHRRDVNTVFQQYALFPHMDVFANIAFGLTMKRVPRGDISRRVGEMLEMVRLEGYGTRRPSDLSGGEQQRVALARALVNRPSILLLDEPLAALDLKLRKQMQHELKSLQADVGITFLYVTHDQEEAMALSDRIAVMEAGRIRQIGTPEDVYERPATRFVADFIGISNLMEGRVVAQEAGVARVAVCLGDEDGRDIVFQAQAFEPQAMGRRVALSIRPERVNLSLGDRAPGDGFLGTVVDRAYLGTDVQYRIRLDSGVELTSVQPNRDASPRPEPGAQVTVHWTSDDVRVLEE